jgi:alkyl sulfatase BDS1-like metallo-beta-lactamase superfamily hydrolase
METTDPQSAAAVQARIKEIFDAFVSHGAAGATSPARVVFELAGEGGGRFLLTLAADAVTWAPGYAAADADVTVKLTAVDFVAVADGAFDGRLAVASERVELSGDRALAERMLELVEPPEPK